MAYENNIPQHKNIAEGNGNMSGQDFGCKPHDHSKGPLMCPISDGMKAQTGGDKRPKPSQADRSPQGRRGAKMP